MGVLFCRAHPVFCRSFLCQYCRSRCEFWDIGGRRNSARVDSLRHQCSYGDIIIWSMDTLYLPAVKATLNKMCQLGKTWFLVKHFFFFLDWVSSLHSFVACCHVAGPHVLLRTSEQALIQLTLDKVWKHTQYWCNYNTNTTNNGILKSHIICFNNNLYIYI